MVMTKLFNKLLTASATVLAAFCSFACSDKIAGTAEEPNQCAFGTESSSSAGRTIESDSGKSLETPNDFPIITSSATSPTPSIEISSSSRSEEDGFDPIHSDPVPSSDSEGGNGSAGTPGFGNPGCYCPIGYTCHCGPTVEPASTLDDYLKKYNITEVTYDDNVLGYNVTFKSCDASQETCFESPSIAKLRELGLHKITKDNVRALPYLFEKTIWAMHGDIYGTASGDISRLPDGCPLYVLNVIDTSPVMHVLTKITKDTIAITEIHDNCGYEPRPFDMHVGFLFEYCGELSESPEIVQTFTLKETLKCGEIDYDEYINKKLK
jgi:hypothetical protein